MAFGVALIIDVLRVWLPSLITVYGSAGATPAEQIGLFALVCFAAAFVAVPLARRAGPSFALLSALGLVVARIVLQGTHGGTPQLVASTAALVFGLWWLVSLAVGGLGSRWAAVGLAGGFGLNATAHALLGGVDLQWRTGWWVWVILVLAGLITLAATSAVPERSGADPAPARFWLAAGPALVLATIVTSAPMATGALVGLPERPLAIAATVAGCSLGVWVASITHRKGRWGVAIAGALLPFSLSAPPVAAVLLGACLGAIARPSRGARLAVPGDAVPGQGSGRVRGGLAAAGGLLAFMIMLFLYYASYDLDLPFPNVAVLFAAALWLTATVVLAGPPAESAERPRWTQHAIRLSQAAALAVAVFLASSGAVPDPEDQQASRSVRLVTYNIRMGFDLTGRFAVDDLAATILDQNPDIVLLSEVDRGWFLNGGHDTLVLLAKRLRMEYVFGPAADGLWGDAILARVPLRSVRRVLLPPAGPTGAQALGAVAELPGGRKLALISTHFQPDGSNPPAEQARVAAGLLREYPGLPVVLAGDLNIEPGSSAFTVLTDAGFRDAFAPSRPVRTFPSDTPREQIDHVLVTEGLTASGVITPDSQASDHRAVAVTLLLP
ncbi:endonuclease/exonuclease/phosphatase family protein [Longispora albida]|uniref:endonuclease/exonuclease/phosphatase family protein n=1 Tax=Longispora albida TaxID=203523 RepID=UPI0003674E09|nr:endonuclease/exonuclease/phosphatase family protein [Longispora albida]